MVTTTDQRSTVSDGHSTEENANSRLVDWWPNTTAPLLLAIQSVTLAQCFILTLILYFKTPDRTFKYARERERENQVIKRVVGATGGEAAGTDEPSANWWHCRLHRGALCHCSAKWCSPDSVTGCSCRRVRHLASLHSSWRPHSS